MFIQHPTAYPHFKPSRLKYYFIEDVVRPDRALKQSYISRAPVMGQQYCGYVAGVFLLSFHLLVIQTSVHRRNDMISWVCFKMLQILGKIKVGGYR